MIDIHTIPCPGCDRPYDRARFASGRAVRCTCGAWVGETRETGIGREGRPRFAADAMLGGLARWLRALGYDTWWDPHVADAELVRGALEERRVILTRDVPLAQEWRLDSLLFIRADDPLDQLREVAAAYPIDETGIFSRCTRCNHVLDAVSADQAGDRVPPAVLASGTELRRCPSCERIYWEGSHTARMRAEIARALADAREAPDESGPTMSQTPGATEGSSPQGQEGGFRAREPPSCFAGKILRSPPEILQQHGTVRRLPQDDDASGAAAACAKSGCTPMVPRVCSESSM